MSNIWKRSLSMVLALVMVFGMMPMQVFATGTGDAPLEQVETPTEVPTEAPTAAPTEATEHVHVYGEAVTTAANCTADGVKTFTCTCGDSYTEAIAAPGHAYENGVCACGETEPTEAPVVETEVPKAELSGQIRKVYFHNVESWEEVYAAWSFDEEDFEDMAFPGQQMEAASGLEEVYFVTVPVEADELLFSDGVEVTEELLEEEKKAGLEITHEISAALNSSLKKDLYRDGAWENYAEAVAALQETEAPTEAPVAETEAPVMAPAPTEDPVQALIGSLPASVNSKAEYDAVYDVVAEIENNGYDLSADQMDAVFAAMNAADEWYNADIKAGTYAGTTYDGTTIDVLDGKTTNAELYDAFAATMGEPSAGGIGVLGQKVFQFGNFTIYNNDDEITLSDSTISVKKSTGSSWGSTKWSNATNFTIRVYHSIKVSITGNDAGYVSYNNTDYKNGDTIKLYAGGEIAVGTVDTYHTEITGSLKPTVSGELLVNYISDNAEKRNVTLNVVGGEYAKATPYLSVSGEVAEGSPVTIHNTETLDNTTNVNYSVDITVDGATLDGNTFTVGKNDVTVTVSFAKKTIEKNTTIGDVPFNTNKSVGDQLEDVKKAIFAAVVNTGASLPAGITYTDLEYKYYPWNYIKFFIGDPIDSNTNENIKAVDITTPASTSNFGIGTFSSFAFGTYWASGKSPVERVRLEGKGEWAGLAVEAEVGLVDGRPVAEVKLKSDDVFYYSDINPTVLKKNIFESIYNGGKPTLTVSDVTVEVKGLSGTWQDVTSDLGMTAIGTAGLDGKVDVRIVFNGNNEYQRPTNINSVTVSLVDNRKEVSIAKTEVTVSYLSATILADMITKIGANYDAVSYKYSTGIISNGDVTADALREAAAASKGNTLEVTVKLNQGDAEYKPFEETVTVSFTDAWYTVTWYEENGETEIDTTDALIGTAPAHADASKEPTVQYSYTFAGWEAVSGVDGDGKITGNASYKATFTESVNRYTVTFIDGNGEIVSAEKYDYDTKASDIVVPAATKMDKVDDNGNVMATYTFEKWDEEIADVTSDATYTATFIEIAKKYNIVFKSHDGEDSRMVEYGVVPEYTAPADYEEGDKYYSFKDWNPKVVAVTGDATYEAVYTDANVYKVTFDANGGTMIEDNIKRVIDGEMVAAIEVTREGYRFNGWYLNGAAYDFAAPVTEDIKLIAQWVEQVTVSFDVEDVMAQTFDIGGKAEEPSAPTKEKAIFGGWYLGESEYDFTTSVTEDITLTANWIADLNGNKVPDADETITIVVNKGNEADAITVSENLIEMALSTADGAKSYIFDSTNPTISITATPVVTDGISTTYVKSVTGAELTYGENFVATANVGVKNGDVIEVTFEAVPVVKSPADVVEYNFYTRDIPYAAIYNSVITTPQIIDENTEVEYTYFARGKMTHTVSIDSLDLDSSVKTLLSTVGINDFSFDMDELWLPLDAKVEESVDLETAVSTYLTKERINGLLDIYEAAHDKAYDDYIAANGDSFLNKIAAEAAGVWAGGEAVGADIEALYEVVYASAYYYGAHEFGYNADGSETVDEQIRIEYSDKSMHWTADAAVTLKDSREKTFINGSDLTLTYSDYLDEDILASFALVDEAGNPVDGTIYSVQLSDPYTYEGKNVSETAYELTVKFAGNENYRRAEKTVNVTVVKAKASIDLPDLNITYGDSYDIYANVSTGNAYGHKQEVIDSLVEIIIGLDVADLEVNMEGEVSGVGAHVQIMLPKDDTLATIFKALGLDIYSDEGETLNFSELQDLLGKLDGALDEFDSGNETVNGITSVLQSITGLVDLSALEITFGGKYPTDIGVYLYGAVSTSSNYETAYDVAYMIIKPAVVEAELAWNYVDENYIFSHQLLQYIDLGAHIVDAEQYNNKNLEVLTFFFGVDENGAFVTAWDGEALGNGAYAEIAFLIEFGNEFYYAEPLARPVVIIPNVVDAQIQVDGVIADEYLLTFDGEAVDAELIVNTELDLTDKLVEKSVKYYGVQTNTKIYEEVAEPVHAGVYAAVATVIIREENGDLAAVGMDAALLVIEPSEASVTVDNGIHIFGTPYDLENLITVDSLNSDVTPDTTVVSAMVAATDDVSANGLAGITGSINVDFPKWVDELIAEHVPGVKEGMTVAELKEKLVNNLPDISDKLEELGATSEIINSMSNLIGNVSKALEQLPDDIELTFRDEVRIRAVGAYLVMAVVTDSDHYPAVDAGLLIIAPDATEVILKYDADPNGNNIFTPEGLKFVDLGAKAYDPITGELNEEATAIVVNIFAGINAKGETVVTDDPTTLDNGVYTEFSYILDVGGKMYFAEPISRVITLAPNTAEVYFVDASGNKNNDQLFTFDNTAKSMAVEAVVNGSVFTPEAKDLAFTYVGVQTNGVAYNSAEAPVHAGVYAVTVSYSTYDENGNGKLLQFGAAVGAMAIEPAASAIEVTGDTVTYDGKGHTATVKATGSGVTEPDYTLISGGAYVSGDIDQIGVDAFHGNVNIDFPAWLDKVLAEHEFAAEGVNTAYLTEFITAYRDDVLALIPAQKLALLGIETEKVIEKLNAYIDELLAILEKLPKDVVLTFKDDVTYTEPGYYFYYGIVTNSDHYPASDTGLLVIEKKPLVFDLLNTTATWNGKGQMVELNNPENADFTTVVIDRKNNIINILLDEDAQYVLNAVAKILGVEFDGDVQMSTIVEKYNGEELAAAIVELIGQLEQLELSEDMLKVLAAVKKELETLPESGTIVINGDLPTEPGKYEVYALTYSQYFETAAAEAVLEIVPVKVEVILDNITKAYGETDPALTYTVRYYDHKGNELADAGIVTVAATRTEGEDVGEYVITATVTLSDDTHYVLIAQPKSAAFEITKASDNGWTEEPGIEGWTYGEEPNAPTGEAKFGEIKVEYRPADGTDADFTEEVPTDAGDYIVRFTVEGTDNYNGITTQKELTIAKAASEIKDAPEAAKNLTYTGKAQELITAGTAEGGKLVYSLSENGPFTDKIPTGTDAGTYTVYYKVEGDQNHTDTEFKRVEVTIAKATPDVKAPTGLTAVEGQTLADVKLPEGFAWADAETTSVGKPGENKFTVIFTPVDSKNFEAVRIEVTIVVEADNSKDGLYPVHMKADHATIAAGAKIYVDGVAYELDEDLIAYVPMDNATFVTTYVYNKQSSDTHEVYPTHMYVWQLTFSGEKDEQWAEGENYTAKRVAEFDDIMQYSGSSIRISGKKGIRMITSIPTAKRNTLINSNMLGWRLMQTGTCVEWADENGVVYNSLTMNTNPKLTGYAYKRGVQDPVFARTNGLDQFTNVLVGFNNDQCKLDLVMRPYMILENVQTGETAVLYGGMVQRSIGYIAYQNRLVYKPGNAAYNFIWDIIHHVYGNKYDADFKG